MSGLDILVVGQTGQLARALARRLPRDGHRATYGDLPDWNLAEPAAILSAIAAGRPAVVINAAAYTAVDRAEAEEALALAVNGTGVGAIARAAAAVGAAFVQVSTDYVFSGDGGAPYTPDDAPNPAGAYGRTKLAGEFLALAGNPRSIIVRTAWVCSPDGANFVKTMLRLAAERDELRVVADQKGAPTFADDLADAIARMLPRLATAPAGDPAFGLFHLTGAPHANWHEFAQAVVAGATARGHGRNPRVLPITTAEYPTPARRPADGRLDCSRIGSVHGISPADWRVSLGHCLDVLLL